MILEEYYLMPKIKSKSLWIEIAIYSNFEKGILKKMPFLFIDILETKQTDV